MLEVSIINKLESLRFRSNEIYEALAKEGATDDILRFNIYTQITECAGAYLSLQFLLPMKDPISIKALSGSPLELLLEHAWNSFVPQCGVRHELLRRLFWNQS